MFERHDQKLVIFAFMAIFVSYCPQFWGSRVIYTAHDTQYMFEGQIQQSIGLQQRETWEPKHNRRTTARAREQNHARSIGVQPSDKEEDFMQETTEATLVAEHQYMFERHDQKLIVLTFWPFLW
jgi:hypothetical protein